jgi:ABC-type transporter Mla subunit MlaD
MDDKIPSYTGSDRILGYVLLSILLFICVGLGAYGIYTLKHPPAIRVLSFSQIGNINTDDPVYIRGIRVGKVHSTRWQSNRVIVYVTQNRSFLVHKGYHIDDMDIGTMGERIIMITDGDSTAPVIGNNDTLYGTFMPGISEAIGWAPQLFAAIDSLTAQSTRLRFGTQQQPSMITKARLLIHHTDTISTSLSHALIGISAVLDPALDSLTYLLNTTAGTIRTTGTALPVILNAADTGIRSINESLLHISSLITRVQSVTLLLEKQSLSAASPSDTVYLQQKLTQVHTLLQYLQNNVLQIKIRLHLW